MNLYGVDEIKLFKRLDSPKKIQDFLAFKIKHNPAKDGVECRSPRMVLRTGKAHCMEGALLAAAILEFNGDKPLLMDLRSTSDDLDHVVALFKQFGRWGAISKTNHAVLRYREPIHKTIRELALSYFHEYFLDSGKKTLREYSAPVDLRYFYPSILLNPLPNPPPSDYAKTSSDLRKGEGNRSSTYLSGKGETATSPSFRRSDEALREVGLKRGPGGVINWRTTEKDLTELPEYLDNAKHSKILSPAQIKNLRKADGIEIKAGKLTEWKNK